MGLLIYAMRIIFIILSLLSAVFSFSQSSDSIARAKITEAMVNKVLRQSLLDEIVEKGGRVVIHEVQRGETWESIADLYDMTEYELKSMNPLFDECSTGLTLDIPVLLSNEELTERLIVSQNSHYARAEELYAAGNYSDAIKAYTKLINSSQSALLAYYKRGCAYYNADKYKKAMNDFGHVLEHGGGEIYPNAEENYNKAYAQVQRQREARARAWGNLLQTGLQMANTYFAAKQQSEMYKQSGMNMYNNVGVGSYAGLDPGSEAYMQRVQANFDNIVNNGMMQLQQYTNNCYQAAPLVMEQFMQQQNQMAQQCHDQWVKYVLGREPTAEEDQQWWINYYSSMSQAYTNVNATTTTTGLNNWDDGQNENVSNSTSSSSKRCKKISVTDMAHCEGSGICQRCNGDKRYWDDSFGVGHWVDPCTTCRGTGECPSCHGTGHR